MKNKECFCTSFLFLINALVAHHNKYNNYAYAFLILAITSLFHHYYYNNITRQIDRIPIILITILTIIIFNSKQNKMKLIQKLYFLFAILSMSYIYFYGYIKKKYSYDKNHRIACRWHSLLHIIAFISGIYLTII
jgi:hypothetical protein